MLWAVSVLRPWRRSLLRHRTEMAHVAAWCDQAMEIAAIDRALADEKGKALDGALRTMEGFAA